MTQATTITLQDVKDHLRVTHSADDTLLQRLLNSATQECLRFINRTELPTLPFDHPVDLDGDSSSEVVTEEVPSSEDPVADDIVNGIILMIQADYDGDFTMRQQARDAAEALWMPYRIGMGV